MITPLQDAVDPVGENGFASAQYVRDQLCAALAAFNVTIEGGELETNGKGHLHIRVTSAAATNLARFAWYVTVTGNTITVAPGLVNAYGNNVPGFIPEISGVPLDNTPAPTLPYINGTNPAWVCLRVKINAAGAPEQLPWQIVLGYGSTPPINTPLIRAINDDPGQPATIYVPIAKIESGVVTAQFWLGRPIGVYWTFNTVHVG